MRRPPRHVDEDRERTIPQLPDDDDDENKLDWCSPERSWAWLLPLGFIIFYYAYQSEPPWPDPVGDPSRPRTLAAYDGPPFFRMTTGGPWDGLNVLEFTPDMTNFLDQLEQQQQNNDNTTEIQKATTRDLCVDDNDVYGESLSKCCNLELLPVNKILSYAHMHDSYQNKMTVGLYSIHYFYSPIIFIGFSLTLLIIQSLYRRKIRNQQQYDDQQQDWIDIPDHNNCANYNTFY